MNRVKTKSRVFKDFKYHGNVEILQWDEIRPSRSLLGVYSPRKRTPMPSLARKWT